MYRNCIVALMFALTLGAAAQNSAPRGSNDRLLTIEEELKQRGLQLTLPVLLQALRSADAQVRWLAAAKLAQDNVSEAIPAIRDALTSEHVPLTRVNLASALARLGDATGISVLQDSCRDSSARPYLRVLATRYMLDLNRKNETCRNALVDSLESRADPDLLLEALSVLSQFHDAPPEQSQRIFQLVVKALAMSEPALRLAASHALDEMGKRAAIPYLQSAIAREQDETLRWAMQADLQHLQEKERR